MLEHVDSGLGYKYFALLKSECAMPNESILEFCTMNDRIGNPTMQMIPELSTDIFISGTSLRYLYHGWLILKHMTPNSSVVEVGCGYGGLCLAIDFLSKQTQRPVRSYACLDLDGPLTLQRRYLANFELSFPVSFHSSSTYGSSIEGDGHFLVSNYCFSEIDDVHQMRYIQTLFPKIAHGFLAWNRIPVYNFGKRILRTEPERPKTFRTNMFVFF